MKNPITKLIILVLVYALTPTRTFAVGESSNVDCVDTVQMTRSQERPESEEKENVATFSAEDDASKGK